MIKYVLFDLDGTLLPMDQDLFVKAYFKELSKRICPLGYTPEALVQAVWHGMKQMLQNDGSRTNEAVFWDAFCQACGEGILQHKPVFDDFYRTDFNKVQAVCGFTPLAQETVRLIRDSGVSTVVATLPVFPLSAIEARLRWASVDPALMQYITCYEDCCFTKPNPAFYREVLEKLGAAPEECLMVGNSVEEDMVAAQEGLSVFLLTDCLINEHHADISIYPHGTFEDLQAYWRTHLP